jgi:hypothetical protein
VVGLVLMGGGAPFSLPEWQRGDLFGFLEAQIERLERHFLWIRWNVFKKFDGARCWTWNMIDILYLCCYK